MTLWTIQEEEWYAKLAFYGQLTGDGRRVPYYWRDAYRWMADQMILRGLPKVRFPVWAWHSYEGSQRRRPDLRHAGLLPAGTHGVRVELSVPSNSFLLSQYEMWWDVLQGQYVSLNEEEFDKMWEKESAGLLDPSTVKASWTRIFDLGCGAEGWYKATTQREIQATLSFVKLDWVVRVDSFVARGYPKSLILKGNYPEKLKKSEFEFEKML